jgi:hypothetical protein
MIESLKTLAFDGSNKVFLLSKDNLP